MGEHELQEALRREAEEKIRALWQEAEALVAARRTELTTALEVRRTELERQQEANCAKIRRQALTLAEQKARQQQLTVDAALEQRLRHLAALIGASNFGKASSGSCPNSPGKRSPSTRPMPAGLGSSSRPRR